MLSLRLFGGLAIELEDGPLQGRAGQKKRLALLTLLAAAPTGRLSRDKVGALLWPERDAERARHQLASSVYELRRACGRSTILSVGDDLELNREVSRSDVAEFEAALRQRRWRDGVGLYVGPFLDGFFLSGAPEFDRWLEHERQRLARAYAGALRSLIEEAERDGDRRGAVRWWERLSDHDPYSSEIALGLIGLLEALGDRPAAVRHAAFHSERVRADLGAEPDPSVTAYARAPSVNRPGHPRRIAPGPGAQGWTRRGHDPAAGRGAPAFRPGEEASGARVSGRMILAVPALIAVAVLGFLGLGGLRERVQAPAPPGPRSVVVLPFASRGPGAGDGYLGDAIAGEVTRELMRVPGLTVISSTSARDYRGSATSVREIARDLRVDAVVEGTLSGTGDRLRVDARLVDARTGRPTWAREYTPGLQEIAALSRAVALDIAAATRAEADPSHAPGPPAPRPVDPRAYDVYLRGRHAASGTHPESHEIAIGYYLRAIEIDPSFALPRSALAALYARSASHAYVHHPDDHARAERAVEAALALDSSLVEPYVVLSEIELHSRHDWNAANRALQRALALGPGSATAHYHHGYHLLARGRFAEAIAAMRRAVDLDPAATYRTAELAWAYYMARRPDEALRLCRLLLSRDPANATAHGVTALALRLRGNHEEALAALRQAGTLSGHRPINRATLAQVLASAGRREEARQVLRELRAAMPDRDVSRYRLAGIHHLLGEREAAVSLLEDAFDAGEGALIWLSIDPVFDGLRQHPRVVALIEKMGLA